MGSIRLLNLLFFFAYLQFALSTIGQPCFLGYYRFGVCTLEERCRSSRGGGIVNNNDNDIYLCGYLYGRPLICCPQNSNDFSNGGGYDDPYNNHWNRYGNNRRNNRFRPGRRRRPNDKNNSKEESEEVTEIIPPANDPYSIAKAKCEEYQEKPEITEAPTEAVFRPFIIGGVDAKKNEFPHMTALGYGEKSENNWLCGGSLISNRYVVSAAHCLFTVQVGDVKRVRLGATKVKTIDTNVQDFDVIERIQHPDYKPPIQYNDLGLIKLDRDVLFNDNIRPICLQTILDLNDTIPIATGWGRIEYGGSSSDDLKKVEINYYAIDQCRESYSDISPRQIPNGIMDETQICAGGINDSKDTCQGDSGGPLQIKNPNYTKGYNLVGITSFGRGCGAINIPGVYTRITHYIPWIQTIVWS